MSNNELNKKMDKKTTGEPVKDSSPQPYRWMSFGIELAGVVGLFMWLGHLADQKLQTSGPWWLLTGFFVAFVGMIYLLLKETGSFK